MSELKEVGKIADDLVSTREEDEQSRSDRHALDMSSDSWWAKFVRPFVLIYILLALSAIEVFSIDVSETFAATMKNWGDLAFMFYFTSRGVEKVAKIANRQIRFLKRNERKQQRRGK